VVGLVLELVLALAPGLVLELVVEPVLGLHTQPLNPPPSSLLPRHIQPSSFYLLSLIY